MNRLKSFCNIFDKKYLIFLLFIQSFISLFVLIFVLKNFKLFPFDSINTINNVIKNPLIKTKSPRILCAVTTQPQNDKKIAAIKETWGKRCDKLYFISSESDPALPAFGVKCEKNDHSHLWCKNRQGIMYGVKEYHHQFDWFLKADDDTYVIIENLKYLLSNYDPNQLIWFGCQFALGGDRNMTYMSGGAGYAISRKAVYELSEEFHKKNKCIDLEEGETGADDVIVGRCLKRLGVQLGDSRDEFHRNRFFPFIAGDFVNPTYNVSAALEWFAKYNVFHNQMGFNCCSNSSISFHYVSPTEMYVYEFFIYHMTVQKNL